MSVGVSCTPTKAKLLSPPTSYLRHKFHCQFPHNIVKLCVRNSTLVSWVTVQSHYLVFLLTELLSYHAFNLCASSWWRSPIFHIKHILKDEIYTVNSRQDFLSSATMQSILKPRSHDGHFLGSFFFFKLICFGLSSAYSEFLAFLYGLLWCWTLYSCYSS